MTYLLGPRRTGKAQTTRYEEGKWSSRIVIGKDVLCVYFYLKSWDLSAQGLIYRSRLNHGV